MVATGPSCQASWLRNLLCEVTRSELKLVTLYVHNKSVIALMKNPVIHGRSKHIDTSFHFICECVEKKKNRFWSLCALESNVRIF